MSDQERAERVAKIKAKILEAINDPGPRVPLREAIDGVIERLKRRYEAEQGARYPTEDSEVP